MSSVELPFEVDFDILLEDAYENMAAAIEGWTDNRSAPDAVTIAENVRVAAVVVALAQNVPLRVLLDFWGQTQGVPRTAAAPATARSTWTFTDTAGHTITAGTEVELVDGDRRARFAVAADVTVAPDASSTDVGEVVLAAVDLGDDGNDYPAQAVNLVDQVAAVDTATTIETTGGGVDEETDDTYQARLAEELQVPGPPILERDFAIRARSVAGVARAVAIKGYNPADLSSGNEGMVTVAVVNTDGGVVPGSVKDDVDELLTDPDRRIVNVIVHVVDPTYTAVNVVFTAVAVAGYLPETVEVAAEAAVAEYLDPANWGATSSSRPDWENREVVRYLEVAGVLDRVEGLDYITALTINGVADDLALDGPAALPDPTSTVDGTVTV